ncbi:ferredoxin [Streptomyces sp. SBC-4]|nr:ferredoxin [Streptomyces sp. SBC-4]MDV5143096.1 ferredoxin [Streptomyces sp. SBC-4]
MGAGRCFLVAPELLDQRADDATVVVLVEDVTGTGLDKAREAADGCPTRTPFLTEEQDTTRSSDAAGRARVPRLRSLR